MYADKTVARNEAAERLRSIVSNTMSEPIQEANLRVVDEALAAERRATVERIREAIRRDLPYAEIAADDLFAILDEEAAR